MTSSLRFIVPLALCAAASAQAAPVQWAGNGHYYEAIRDTLTWDQARAAAAAMTHNGLQGYLITITSADENAFAAGLTNGVEFWAGATDAAVEGQWIWADGPEAGQALTYTNWNSGEPNNAGDEDYLHVNYATFAGWNDIPGTYGNPFYVVEFGPSTQVPEPASLPAALAALALLAVARRRVSR